MVCLRFSPPRTDNFRTLCLAVFTANIWRCLISDSLMTDLNLNFRCSLLEYHDLTNDRNLDCCNSLAYPYFAGFLCDLKKSNCGKATHTYGGHGNFDFYQSFETDKLFPSLSCSRYLNLGADSPLHLHIVVESLFHVSRSASHDCEFGYQTIFLATY